LTSVARTELSWWHFALPGNGIWCSLNALRRDSQQAAR